MALSLALIILFGLLFNKSFDKINLPGLLGMLLTGILLEPNKLWIFAEIMLFVLIGAEVNINLALESGLLGLLIVFCGLIARGIGVLISTTETDLNFKELILNI